jgi:hypothetical protein
MVTRWLPQLQASQNSPENSNKLFILSIMLYFRSKMTLPVGLQGHTLAAKVWSVQESNGSSLTVRTD